MRTDQLPDLSETGDRARSSYGHYVRDEPFLRSYNAHQRQFVEQMHERDRVMLGLIDEKTGGKGSLLDIGCSTGNLLAHISRAFPRHDARRWRARPIIARRGTAQSGVGERDA
jgi:hypothetical protein